MLKRGILTAIPGIEGRDSNPLGSYWVPGSSLVKFGVTGCFYRFSPRVALDAESLKKAV
jgi:hypothetical protein